MDKTSPSNTHNSLNIVSDNRQKVKHDPWSVMYLSQFSRLAMIWEGEAPAEPMPNKTQDTEWQMKRNLLHPEP